MAREFSCRAFHPQIHATDHLEAGVLRRDGRKGRVWLRRIHRGGSLAGGEGLLEKRRGNGRCGTVFQVWRVVLLFDVDVPL
jgi:hypothetical protein